MKRSVWPHAYIIFQYLAFYNDVNLPNSIVKFFAKYWKEVLKITKRLSKCCKSGKISPNLATLETLKPNGRNVWAFQRNNDKVQSAFHCFNFVLQSCFSFEHNYLDFYDTIIA